MKEPVYKIEDILPPEEKGVLKTFSNGKKFLVFPFSVEELGYTMILIDPDSTNTDKAEAAVGLTKNTIQKTFPTATAEQINAVPPKMGIQFYLFAQEISYKGDDEAKKDQQSPSTPQENGIEKESKDMPKNTDGKKSEE